MRASEFITEHTDVMVDGSGLGVAKHKPNAKLNKIQHGAIPGLKTTPDLPSHYYDMYRLGIHMAGSPANQKMDPRSAVANQMAVVAYSKADADIINKSAKEMGIDMNVLSDEGSKELADTNTKSPSLNPGPIKRNNK